MRPRALRLTAGTIVVAVVVGLLVFSTSLSSPSHGPPAQVAPSRVEVVETTANLSERLTRMSDLTLATGKAPHGTPTIHVDDTVRYQRVVGVGAAMTDTSAWLLHDELSPSARASVMSHLFGREGIHLAVTRVPIGATDYTRTGVPYSYDDLPRGRVDPKLTRFSVAHDEAYILPILRQMFAISPHIEIVATPWSPPGWMKANDALSNRSGAGTLLPAYYRTLANYFVAFIHAYARARVRVDAIAPQNEPGQSSLYPGMNLSPADEAAFISRDLAPALAAGGMRPKIYGYDWKWLRWRRAFALAINTAAAKDLSGIAWHCYSGNPTVMTSLHRMAPSLDQIESECSDGGAPGPPGELMIASFRNWASTVLLWNLALDPAGGPVQPPNYGCPRCTGVVTVDGRSHTVKYGPDYYVLGQLSRFVQRGARRIASNHFVTYNTPTRHHRINYATDGIDDVAFRNPDGSEVLLAQNNDTRRKRFAVAWHGRVFTYDLAPGAIVTFKWGLTA